MKYIEIEPNNVVAVSDIRHVWLDKKEGTNTYSLNIATSTMFAAGMSWCLLDGAMFNVAKHMYDMFVHAMGIEVIPTQEYTTPCPATIH